MLQIKKISFNTIRSYARRMYTQSRPVFATLITPPFAVLLAMLAITFFATAVASSNISNVKDDAAQKNISESQLQIKGSMDSYAQILWGGVGRINSGTINRAAWNSYVGAYDIEKNFPGMQALGVIELVQDNAIDQYMAQKSIEYNRSVTLFPKNTNATHAVLSFVSPESNSRLASIGFDAAQDTNRQVTMEKAASEGTIALTDKINLVQVDKNNNDPTSGAPGFIMYVPYYNTTMPLSTPNERLAALRGFVFAGFRTDRVFNPIFTDNSSIEKMDLTIYLNEKTSNNELFSTISGKDIKNDTLTQRLQIYNQTFLVEYHYDSSKLISSAQTNTPLIIFVGGSTIALLVSFMIYFLLRSRYHRLSYEKERDIKLAKDELLSLASHQLRTPATGVKQYLGMVLQGFAGNISEKQTGFLQKAYDSNDRQLHIINDILYLAKLDAGRMVMAKTDFNLASMVQDVIDEQKDDITTSELHLTIKIPRKVPYYGDAHMLRMVVENVLSNAIKYTSARGQLVVQLNITTTEYKISVKDSGVGIAEQDTVKLFKQFSRIPNDRSHLVTGTGVGLYLAQHFTKMHQGSIICKSELGKGSTFTIILPRQTATSVK